MCKDVGMLDPKLSVAWHWLSKCLQKLILVSNGALSHSSCLLVSPEELMLPCCVLSSTTSIFKQIDGGCFVPQQGVGKYLSTETWQIIESFRSFKVYKFEILKNTKNFLHVFVHGWTNCDENAPNCSWTEKEILLITLSTLIGKNVTTQKPIGQYEPLF